MIRCGLSKPKIYFSRAHNDMGNFTPSMFDVSYYFYLSTEDYIEKKTFSHFEMIEVGNEYKKYKDKHNKEPNLNDVSSIEAFIFLPKMVEMDRLIKKSNGQLWQFNAFSSDLEGYTRQTLAIGQKDLTRWSWFDAYILLPLFKYSAIILNKLLYFYNIYELNQWNKFLKGLRK